MAFKPTFEQEQAINQKGSILVSAAAGSGKTAVLVERVVKMLTDEKQPVSADKLLVVTFTNAAAAELRLRIDKRLNEEFQKHPDDQLLRRQKMLIHNAKFCTIDSFCINFIRENFEVTGVNPSFKIADRATLLSIERSVMSTLINEQFDNQNADFLALLGFLGEDYDDSKLQSKIYQIARFSRILPFPKLWFENIIENYRKHATQKSEDWFKRQLEFAKDIAIDASLKFKGALSLLESNSSAYSKYSGNYVYFCEISGRIREMCENVNWDAVFSLLQNITPPKCKSLSAEEKDSSVTASIKLRDEGKKLLSKLGSIIYATKSAISQEILQMLPHIEKLFSLTESFEDRINSALIEKNLMTFSLAEQTAFKVLAKIDEGRIVKSDIADEYISLYDAILVDEYQDTNSLQDTLFNILSDGGKKLFCVGDIKQSIYRFRGSNPLHFLNKKNEYKSLEKRDNDDGLRIDLGCNFRSRPEICKDINDIFSKIVCKDNSGFDYDDMEKLIPMAEFPDSDENKTEYHFIDFGAVNENSNNAFENKLEAEAEIIADLVEQTVNKNPFLRCENGPRKAEFSDITILVRSMQSKGNAYIKALKDRGIPVSVAASDVIGTDEVNTLLSLLKIINNPSDDVALLTVMTSPIFAFTMNELAKIRLNHKHGNLISSVTATASNGNDKAKNFLNLISRLRYNSIIMPVAQLIDEIFDSTDLLNIMSSRSDGDARRLNLLGILNFASSFEQDSRRGLGAFINYFSDIENKDFKLASTGSTNSVTVMSIHKSKGLQFPVCILANASSQFNLTDLRDRSVVSEIDGFSTVYYLDGVKCDNMILRNLMQNEEKKSLLAEELRILYVALTRAEEKLMVVSSYNDLRNEIETKLDDIKLTHSTDRVDYSLFRKNSSYADWILESLLIDGRADELLLKEQSENIVVHTEPPVKTLCEKDEDIELNCNVIEELKKDFNFVYPYEHLLPLEAKASVTDIVHKADQDTFRFSSRPSFLQTGKLSSAEKGTAVHKAMQYLDFNSCKISIEDELGRLYENLYLTEQELNIIDREGIINFVNSPLCDRILSSAFVKREMKFITEFPATELNCSLDSRFSDEMIVVQGAVDLVFEENGELIIVDFKTDRNKDELELKSAYSEQLEIYAKACSKILNKPTKELIIYSFSLNKQIKI